MLTGAARRWRKRLRAKMQRLCCGWPNGPTDRVLGAIDLRVVRRASIAAKITMTRVINLDQ